jgi:hypothetical protein
MKTFYFNTGVRQGIPSNELHRQDVKPTALSNGQVWVNGTKQIPFSCEDVPDKAMFLFACDNKETSSANVISRELHNTSLISKYAHFRLN